MNKSIKKLKHDPLIKLISFPFENINRKTNDSFKPSELTCDNDLVTSDKEILISDTLRSDKFEEIQLIIGENNYNDVRHVDTAYKEKCQIFISPDKKDIITKGDQLYKLTGIKFFYCEDIDEITHYIKERKYYC
jgi:hypothetical protein